MSEERKKEIIFMLHSQSYDDEEIAEMLYGREQENQTLTAEVAKWKKLFLADGQRQADSIVIKDLKNQLTKAKEALEEVGNQVTRYSKMTIQAVVALLNIKNTAKQTLKQMEVSGEQG